MTTPTYNYIVPGIFDRVNDPKDWDFQAQAWIRDHTGGVACGYNYQAGWATATLLLDKHAAEVGEDLVQAKQAGQIIRYVGHSNGCRILARALELFPQLVLDDVHWFAPAMKKNCAAGVGFMAVCAGNGLNDAAARNQFGSITLYVSPEDEILGLPGVSYGLLGKEGPENLSPELAGRLKIVTRECRHSDWVGKNFEESMRLVTGVAA